MPTEAVVVPSISVKGNRTPEVEAMLQREWAEAERLRKAQAQASEEVRSQIKEAVQRLGECQWEVGHLLLQIRRASQYRTWGFTYLHQYVERELGMPRAKAKRLMTVADVFAPYQAELKDLGWSVLSEACPIAKAVGVETAITVAREGREAVRQWKEKNQDSTSNAGWKTISLRVPSDVYDTYAEVVALAEKIGEAQGATFPDDQEWQQFHAVVIAALGVLRTEWDAHAAAGE